MEKVSIFVAAFLLRFFSILPRRLTKLFGAFLGLIGYTFVVSRRNIGIKNLTLCFPEMSEKEKHRIIKAHFKYLLTSVLEYGLVFYASKARIKKLITFKNTEYVDEFYGKRPIILLCPHFVALDLAGVRLSIDYIGFSLYTRQKNMAVAKRLKEARIRFMKDKGGDVFDRGNEFLKFIRKLRKEKQIFYYLPDQDLGEHDSVFVPFFAHPETATVNVLPKLVTISNAVVIPMVICHKGNGYEIEFSRPFTNYPTGNVENDVITMNQAIEKLVLEHIEEYFWLHKRFKTQKGIKERGLIYK